MVGMESSGSGTVSVFQSGIFADNEGMIRLVAVVGDDLAVFCDGCGYSVFATVDASAKVQQSCGPFGGLWFAGHGRCRTWVRITGLERERSRCHHSTSRLL